MNRNFNYVSQNLQIQKTLYAPIWTNTMMKRKEIKEDANGNYF